MTEMPLVFANILQPLIDVFEPVLVFIHDHVVGGSWGLAIIGLTIVIRAALFPLTLKQYHSMQGMQRLQPQLKELQAKYKEDKQRLQQETMKLWQENGVNPFGSCLSLAPQIPVFISLFYLLRKDLKLDICGPALKAAHVVGSAVQHTGCDKVAHGSAKFLFIPDVTVGAKGGVLIGLIVLYVGTQIVSSLLMSVSADRNQRIMMLALPVFFTPIVIGFPAGLLVYWITTNAWTVGQQLLVKRIAGTHPLDKAAESEPAGESVGRAKSLPAKAAEAPAAEGAQGRKASRRPDRDEPNGPAASPRSSPPPASPRKKKKRSGRRR